MTAPESRRLVRRAHARTRGWARARSLLTTFILLVVSAFALLTVVLPLALGAHTYTVLTGSMQPGMPPGSLVAVRETPIDDIRIGDVITYQIRSGDPAVVTHRVVGATSSTGGDRLLLTRGDANDVDDPPVQREQLRGVVVMAVPYLGYPGVLVGGQERGALVAAIGVAVVGYGLALLLAEAVRSRRRRRTGAALLIGAALAASAGFAAPSPASATTGADRLLLSDDGGRFVSDGSLALFADIGPLAPGATASVPLWIRNAGADPARAVLRVDVDVVDPVPANLAFARSLRLSVDDVVTSTGEWASGVIAPGDTLRIDVGLHMDAAAANDSRRGAVAVTPVVRLTDARGAPAATDDVPPPLARTGTDPLLIGRVALAALVLVAVGAAVAGGRSRRPPAPR